MKDHNKNTKVQMTNILLDGKLLSIDDIDILFDRDMNMYCYEIECEVWNIDNHINDQIDTGYYCDFISKSLPNLRLNAEYFNKLSIGGFRDRRTNKIKGNFICDTYKYDY